MSRSGARSSIRERSLLSSLILPLGVLALAVGAMMFLFRQSDEQGIARDADLCPLAPGQIAASAVFLFDFTKPLDPALSTTVGALLRETTLGFARDTEIRVFSLSDSPTAPRDLVGRLCKPFANDSLALSQAGDQQGAARDCDDLPAQIPNHIRDSASSFCAAREELATELESRASRQWMAGESVANSYLVEALEDIKLDSPAGIDSQSVYIFSDMMQHTQWYSHLDLGWSNWNYEEFAGLLQNHNWYFQLEEDVTAKRVEVFYVPRLELTDRPDARKRHQLFWRSYFDGADVVFHDQQSLAGYRFVTLTSDSAEVAVAADESANSEQLEAALRRGEEQLERQQEELRRQQLEIELQQQELERLALEEAERRAERERLARMDAERLAREEETARLERERAALEEAERLAREEAAEAERERLALEEAERLAQEEEAARLERERVALEEAERLAREEAARVAEEERLAAEAAEAERERLALEEAERLAREEEAARLERERVALEEAERLAREEAARVAEEERLAAEAAEAERERLALEEAERLAREEETARLERERVALEEAERLAREEAARVAEEERLAAEAAEAERERLAHEEAERLAREEETARLERERVALEEAERLAQQEEAPGIDQTQVEQEAAGRGDIASQSQDSDAPVPQTSDTAMPVCPINFPSDMSGLLPNYPRGGRDDLGTAEVTVEYVLNEAGETIDSETRVIPEESRASRQRYFRLFAVQAVRQVRNWRLTFDDPGDGSCTRVQARTILFRFAPE